MENLTIGTLVTKVAPGDYTNGRGGVIIDIRVDLSKYKIHWKTNSNGSLLPGKGIRTWCQRSGFKIKDNGLFNI